MFHLGEECSFGEEGEEGDSMLVSVVQKTSNQCVKPVSQLCVQLTFYRSVYVDIPALYVQGTSDALQTQIPQQSVLIGPAPCDL